MAEHGWLGPIEWAAKASARPGENICGDKLIAVDVEGTAALMGVLDGLGHGAEAAEAAKRGVVVGGGAVGGGGATRRTRAALSQCPVRHQGGCDDVGAH